jgi:O-antigen ligase
MKRIALAIVPRVPSKVPEGLLFALTAFGPFAFGCVEPWSRTVLEILAFLLALTCFLRGRRDLPPMASWFWLVPASFAAFGALQGLTAVAPDLPRPWAPFTAAPSATQTSVILWAAYAALVWSVPQVLSTHEAARRYCRILFALGCALAAQGMLQAATGNSKLYWLRPASNLGAFGPYYNRDHAANVLLMTMAVGIGILMSRRRRETGAQAPQGRLAAGAGVALVFAGFAVCGSRAAFLAIPLAASLLALVGAGFEKHARSRRLRLAAALAGAAFTVLFAFRHVGAGAEAGALTDHSIAQRFYIYGDSVSWLRDSPLFGTGLGSFETVYPAYQDMDLNGLAEHAHSDWLEITLETGLVGLLAAVAAAALLLFGAARSWLAAESSEMRALIGGGLGAAAAFSIHSLFEFAFQIPGNAVVFFGLVGFLLSAPLWKDKAALRVRPRPPRAWAAAAALVVFTLVARAAARPPADDPKRFRALAARLYAGPAASEKRDAAALRAALRLSMTAAELRPVDYKSLAFAGTALARLGRSADARDFFDRSRLVRFEAAVPGSRRSPGPTEREIATFKSLGLGKK